jgi:hypothetical protein
MGRKKKDNNLIEWIVVGFIILGIILMLVSQGII